MMTSITTSHADVNVSSVQGISALPLHRRLIPWDDTGKMHVQNYAQKHSQDWSTRKQDSSPQGLILSNNIHLPLRAQYR